jgi:protein TonB
VSWISIILSMVIAVSAHLGLIYWLWQLPISEKVTPVALISLELVDEPAPPTESETQEHDIQPLISLPEPDPMLTQDLHAEPLPLALAPESTPEPIIPVKPVIKQIQVKPRVADKKPPQSNRLAKTTSTYEAPVSSQVARQVEEKLAVAPAPSLVEAKADYLNNPKPSYPRLSKRMGEQGEVRVKVHVGINGEVLSVEMIRTSGFERLDESALSSVKHWKFSPAKHGNEVVSSWVEIPISFVLEEML